MKNCYIPWVFSLVLFINMQRHFKNLKDSVEQYSLFVVRWITIEASLMLLSLAGAVYLLYLGYKNYLKCKNNVLEVS